MAEDVLLQTVVQNYADALREQVFHTSPLIDRLLHGGVSYEQWKGDRIRAWCRLSRREQRYVLAVVKARALRAEAESRVSHAWFALKGGDCREDCW